MRRSALIVERVPWSRLPDYDEYDLFELMGSEDMVAASLAVEDFITIFNDFPEARNGLIENLKNEVKSFLLEGLLQTDEQNQRMYNLLLKSSVSLILLFELLQDEDIIADGNLKQEIKASFNESKAQAKAAGGFEQILDRLDEIEFALENNQQLLGSGQYAAEDAEMVDGF